MAPLIISFLSLVSTHPVSIFYSSKSHSTSSNYTGRTRITRLIFIANHTQSASLRKAASQSALDLLIQSTDDTATYLNIVNVRNTLPDGKTKLPQEESYKLNQSWVDSTNEKNATENEKLDLELRNYQNNLMKESIRVSTLWCTPLDNETVHVGKRGVIVSLKLSGWLESNT